MVKYRERWERDNLESQTTTHLSPCPTSALETAEFLETSGYYGTQFKSLYQVCLLHFINRRARGLFKVIQEVSGHDGIRTQVPWPLVQCSFPSSFCPNPVVTIFCLLSRKHPTSPNMSSALWKWEQQPTHKSLPLPVQGHPYRVPAIWSWLLQVLWVYNGVWGFWSP